MTVKELGLKNRSYRRFYEEKEITMETLLELCDIGRCTASAGNKQVTRFKLVCDSECNKEIFSTLRWAGYYKDWDGPVDGERPAGYILLVSPKNVNAAWDEGIIAQTILLAAVEKGLGGCILGNIDRANLDKKLEVPEGNTVKLAIALGHPKEEVVIEEISDKDSVVYYRDENQVHHVPKIKLDDLIL